MYKPEENKIVITLEEAKSIKKNLLKIKKKLLEFDNVKTFLTISYEGNGLILASRTDISPVILMKSDCPVITKAIKTLGFTTVKNKKTN